MSESEKMFEKALRMKLKFQYKGICTVEDLWDLSPTNLNQIHKDLWKMKKDDTGGDLGGASASAEDMKLDLRLEIVKYIHSVKVRESAEKANAVAEKQRRDKIREIIANKKDAELLEMDIEDLEKML